MIGLILRALQDKTEVIYFNRLDDKQYQKATK